MDLASQDPSPNLFPDFTEMDLRYLKGHAILLPSSQLKQYDQHDDAIKLLEIYDGVLESSSAEARLVSLFRVKDKWTADELHIYLADWLEMGWETFLLKNAKMLKEKNPFDESKEITYYINKF